MIIDDFDRMEIILSFDRKADPVLVIDTNAVLSRPISVQLFKTICGWNFQILQASCIVNHDQSSQCHSLNNLRELPGENLVVDFLRFLVSEAFYHTIKSYPFRVYMSIGYIDYYFIDRQTTVSARSSHILPRKKQYNIIIRLVHFIVV